MHVFITGATGHIGSALVPELIAHGHQVTGLARSPESAAALVRQGAAVREGELDDLDGLRAAAAEADGVIHLAFREDLMRSGDLPAAVAKDLAAIRALGEPLEGTGKAFVGVSVLLPFAGLGRAATERDTLPSGMRIDAENHLIALAGRGVRSSVVRLTPITHSPVRDRHGFATVLIETARRTGVSAYVGDGRNRWAAGHTEDAATLFRLALEKAPAGSRLHAVGEEGVTTETIATAIGEHLGLPVVSLDPEDAPQHFGFLADLFRLDAPASSVLTQELLGWQPEASGLLEDLGDRRYYGE